jgi:hypothetical protein
MLKGVHLALLTCAGCLGVRHFSGATGRATFVKPSTNFTDSLPSLFALLSGLWFKNRRGGPQIGKAKNGEAASEDNIP